MNYYGLVEPTSGNLVSVGTIAMFPDGNLDAFDGVYDVVEFGTTKPNFAFQLWNPTTRQMMTRPAPIIVSRVDDAWTWLLADPDFQTLWSSLNNNRKTTTELAVRRILSRMLGSQINRDQNEQPEL